MWTAGPATGAAFALLEVLDSALNAAAARRLSFGRNNPTDPFVLRQRRQILPRSLRRCLRADGLAQVRRQFVHRAGSAIVLDHNVLPEQGMQ